MVFALALMSLLACSPRHESSTAEDPLEPVLVEILGLRIGAPLDVPECYARKGGNYESSYYQEVTPCWMGSSWPSSPNGTPRPTEVDDGLYYLLFNDKQVPPGVEHEVSVSVWHGVIHEINVRMHSSHNPGEVKGMLVDKFGSPNVQAQIAGNLRWATSSAEAIYLGDTPRYGEALLILGTKEFHVHSERMRKSRSAESF